MLIASPPFPQVSQACFLCGAALEGADVCAACGAVLGERPPPELDPRDALVSGMALADGKYVLGGLLGRGGFGITYRATDVRLERRLAVKELFPAGAGRRGAVVLPPATMPPAAFTLAVDRFLAEARVLARFSHPSIVAVHDVFQENETAYVVMELLDGETLARQLEQRLLRAGEPFREAELVRLAQQLTEALDLMHAQGVLHRDIKPDNILSLRAAGGTSEPRAVFIDFGAAREFGGATLAGPTSRQSVVITPGYAPLEQYAEQAARGPYTDVYALAATLYHLATGVQPPPATDRASGVLLKRPRQLNPALSLGFERALVRALEMRIEDRTQRADDFFRDLSAYPAPRATPPPTAPTTPAPLPAPDAAPARTALERRGPDSSLPEPDTSRGGQLERAAQVLLGRWSAPDTNDVRREELVCPVCRASAVIDPAKASGALPCPVCRRGELSGRLPAHRLDRCPSCRAGDLTPPGHAAHASVLRRSLSGIRRVLRTVRPTAQGQSASGAVRCDRCLERTKLAHGLRTDQGTHACGACGAEFDETAPGVFAALGAPMDPHGALESIVGRPIGVSVIRRMAAGKANPYSPGLICPTCTAEFHWAQWELRLESFDPARDHHGVGARYHGRRLPWADWQRVARGLPAREEADQLRDAACRELWEALGSAEIAIAGPRPVPDSFGAVRGERTLLAFPTVQYRPTGAGWRVQDRGHLWVTADRVLFGGQRRVIVPHHTVSHCDVRVADGAPVLCLDAWDQFSPLYFTGPRESIAVDVGGIVVQLPIDTRRVVELIRARARRG